MGPSLLHGWGVVLVLGIAGCGISVAVADGLLRFFGAGLWLLVLSVAIVDQRSFIIPDRLSVSGGLLGLAGAAIETGPGAVDALARGCGLGALFLLVRSAYSHVRGRDGLGLGDVKLAGVAGIWLDWPYQILAVETACFAAIASILVHRARGEDWPSARLLPFGLYFAPAIWLGWLAQEASILDL